MAQTGPTNRFAIVLDGVVYSAPSVQGVITDGAAQIRGFSDAEAKALVATLKYGALPLAFTVSAG